MEKFSIDFFMSNLLLTLIISLFLVIKYLLRNLYYNEFGFAPENIQAVKDALLLEHTADTALYGKTGTGQINGQNCTGWFVGYLVRNGSPYFFALNIQGQDACGSTAAQIVQEILVQRESL